MDLIIGPHINKNMSFKDSITDMILQISNKTSVIITAMAMFVAGPKSYLINVNEDDINFIKNNNLQVFVHNTYISVPWKGQCVAIASINKQLVICEQINAKGFIIHLPKDATNETIIEQLMKIIDYEKVVCIYLEIPAISKGSSVFHKTERLNNLFDDIRKKIDTQERHVGLCVDTAHIWSCGVDISNYTTTRDWLHSLTMKNIIFHLNDNKKPLGFAPDEHMTLMDGEIWKEFKNVKNKKESGLYAVLEFAKKNAYPIILERKIDESFYNDYKLINILI